MYIIWRKVKIFSKKKQKKSSLFCYFMPLSRQFIKKCKISLSKRIIIFSFMLTLEFRVTNIVSKISHNYAFLIPCHS